MIVTSYNIETNRYAMMDEDRFHMTINVDVGTFDEVQQILTMINDTRGKNVTMSFEKKGRERMTGKRCSFFWDTYLCDECKQCEYKDRCTRTNIKKHGGECWKDKAKGRRV